MQVWVKIWISLVGWLVGWLDGERERERKKKKERIFCALFDKDPFSFQLKLHSRSLLHSTLHSTKTTKPMASLTRREKNEVNKVPRKKQKQHTGQTNKKRVSTPITINSSIDIVSYRIVSYRR